ncbi:MAG: hypothetical protein R3236_06605, partial [Phycisphaeraceae bacterium]|nr:hypothetical protein [Phycisphaeraceae bacterium]
INPEESLALGYWYADLAAEAPEPFKIEMYRKAEACLEKGLADTEGKGLSGIKAKLSLKNIKKKLAKHEEAGAGQWIDLLKTVDPAKYLLSGRTSDIRTQAGGLLISNGYGGGTPCLAIPAVPTGDYELQLAVGFPKKGTAIVLLPVGKSSVALEIANTGHIALAHVSGQKWPQKPVKLPSSGPGAVKVTLRVALKGNAAAIQLSPTGSTKALNWTGSAAALSPAGWEKAKLKSIGISVVGYPKAVFSLLKIRSRSGKIVPLTANEMQAAAARMKAK